MDKKILSFEDLQEKAKGTVVSLPGWQLGEVVNVRLKRPSLIGLVADGTIPNKLLSSAASMFFGSPVKETEDPEEMGETFQELSHLLEMVAKEALVEPTYQEFEEAGVNLTDEQLSIIWAFVQEGVDALTNFREVKADEQGAEHSNNVQ